MTKFITGSGDVAGEEKNRGDGDWSGSLAVVKGRSPEGKAENGRRSERGWLSRYAVGERGP